ARSRVSAFAVGVGLPVSAKVQLGELTPIAVPLEHDNLCPIVPDRRGDDNILVDIDIGALVRPANHATPISSGCAIHPPPPGGELQIAPLVACVMDADT